MKYCIRNNGIENRYLKRDGTWGIWEEKAVFTSQNAAEKFAERCGIEVYGLFPA